MTAKGSCRVFPKYRATVLDIARESQRIPSFPVLRTMKLAELKEARASCSVRIGWTTLFCRAFALVCRELPELRDLFVTYPIRYLYRHPLSVCSISVHRKDDAGAERLIWGKIVDAESSCLAGLQSVLDAFVTAPMNEVYREGMKLERSPALLRRLTWWLLMNLSGRKRAKHIGTFSISSLGGQSALNLHHPLITTSSLAFGPLNSHGELDVVLICDHRAIDGVLAARALELLDAKLCTQMVHELRSIGRRSEQQAAAA